MNLKKFSWKMSFNQNNNNEEEKTNKILSMNSSAKMNIKSNFITKNIKPSLNISLNNTVQNSISKSRMQSSKLNNLKTQLSPKIYPFINFNNYCSTNTRLSNKNTQFNSLSTKNSLTITYNTPSNKKLYPKKNKNHINFVDRNKIRNIGLISLKLFDNYLEENNISFITNNSKKKSITQNRKETYLYRDFKRNSVKANFFNSNSNVINIENNMNKKLKNLVKENHNHYLEINNSYNNNFLIKAKNKFKNKRKKLTLRELMELNPYHYVSNKVKYSNSIQMKKISEKLGNIHGADFNIKAKSQRHFFRGQSYKNKLSKSQKKNNRVINSFQVIFNTNLSHKSGLVWRILQKFKQKRNNIIPSFRQACKFKGYSELWKYHSMLIEKILVNYSEFKWFFEKEKMIKKEVFNEFLECKKIQEEMKGEISFVEKVFLAFDDLGTEEINIKTFYLIMEITSKSNNNLEKINFISKLLEDYNFRNEEKSVNLFDMYELFKCLIVNENAQKDVRYLYEAIKEDLNKGEKIEDNIYVSKNDVCDFLLNNKFIHKLIQTFKIQYKYANVNYLEEINSCFNSTVRNVKKFLNEQNEVICDAENKYYKFEEILKSIQNKNDKKEKVKMIEDEFENDNIEDDYHD